MSERWAAVRDGKGNIISIGTVVADPLPKGLTVEWADIVDGQIPTIFDGRLVGVDPVEPELAPSLEDLVAAKVTEELDRRGVAAENVGRTP